MRKRLALGMAAWANGHFRKQVHFRQGFSVAHLWALVCWGDESGGFRAWPRYAADGESERVLLVMFF